MQITNVLGGMAKPLTIMVNSLFSMSSSSGGISEFDVRKQKGEVLGPCVLAVVPPLTRHTHTLAPYPMHLACMQFYAGPNSWGVKVAMTNVQGVFVS